MGSTVALVGYGLSLQATDTAFGGTRQVSGERRLTQVTVHALAESHWEYRFSGTDSGSCFGDSGGPAATTRNGTALIVGMIIITDPEPELELEAGLTGV